MAAIVTIIEVAAVVDSSLEEVGVACYIYLTMSDKNPRIDDDERVIDFRLRTILPSLPEPLQNLEKYERDRDDADDYRHRMIVNVLAFILVVGLIGLGLWLANTMADMRKGQDCVLSGRHSCSPVEFTGNPR